MSRRSVWSASEAEAAGQESHLVMQGESQAARPHPAAAPTDGRAFRADVEGLRAVAILLVIAYHAHLPAARGGFIGVDVFFVLSGFLITGILAAEIRATGR